LGGLWILHPRCRSARRSIFIVDPQGVIRYSKEEPLSLSYRSVDDILKALRDSGLLPAQA